MRDEQWTIALAEHEIRTRLANGARAIDPRELFHAWLCFELKKPLCDCDPLARRVVATLLEELRPHYPKPKAWKDARARVCAVLAEHARE